ncbi:ATP-binding protein [Streptomyces aurantiacus]|uniref:ATP-binding protein n=1 Tax=Streptomyces aurantiacus TaxID=47760 RepID=UPI00068944D4|nr:ATP-binding protein [Streptomyces aurantiacus]
MGDRIVGVADRGRPVLLVLDDLQWAGAETLDLFADLIERSFQRAVLVVGTYRDVEVPSRLRELLGRVARAEPVRVRLGGLPEEAVGELVRAVAHRPVTAETARAVRQRSGGNPFFVREIARLYAADGTAALSQVPDGVRDIVRRRLAALPPGARTVLRQAAVLGPVVDLDALAALTGDEDAVLDAVEAGAGAGFLAVDQRRPERVEFAHDLVHETLYGDLSALRRARLHAALGEILERLRPDAVEAIAHHLVSAGTRAPAARTADFATRAARRAEARGAPHEAARLWGAALDAYDRGRTEADDAAGARTDAYDTAGTGARTRERLTLLMGLVRNLAVTGALAEARRHRADALVAAEATGDPELTARVIGAFDVPGIWARNDDEPLSRRIVAAALRTLDALPDDASPGRRAVRCRLLSTVAMETRGSRTGIGADAAREAETLARAAMEEAPGAEEPAALLAFALNGRYLHTFHRAGLAPERARVGAELTDLAARHGLVPFEVLGHLMLLQAHSALAEFDRADAHAAAVDRLAERHGLPLVGVFTQWYGALRAAVAGRMEEAETASRAAARRMRGSGMSGMDGLLEAALECLAVQGGGGESGWGSDGESGAGADPRQAVPRDQLLEARLCLRARAALRGTDVPRDVLDALYRDLLPAAGELAGAGSGVLTLEPVAQYLGDLALALGRPATAATHYRQALALAERAGAPHWERTLLRRSATLDSQKP